jgi:TP901 family phage tail tape measure protein
MNFTSSITLAFKDAFSSGFAAAKNSFAGMTGALGEINKNQSMNRLAADLSMAAAMTEPFRQKLSAMMDGPAQLAGQFDSSMRNIQSLTNESNESLAQLGNELLAVGSGTVAGPNAIADAYYNIASGIGRAEVRMDTLRAATALAESGQADLGAATSGLISVVNAYNTPAENMTDLSDVFFQTVRKGVGSLDGFVSSMSSIAGISASVGIGFDELGSSMAFITSKGQTESVAATQLKAAITALLKPNKDLSEALTLAGISSGSAMLEQYGLAESLNIVRTAVGGSQDAMAAALGSTEALQAAITLTDASYTAFASSYADGLSGATAAALEAQAQSYEARVAKLQAASDSLAIQMGDDTNKIKGFFVDIGTGFLTHVVSPLMSSPVGGVFQGIVAGAGLAAQSILSLGSGVLNTASQLVVMTATLQNAGGFTQLFGSALDTVRSGAGLLLTPLKAAGTGLAAFSASVKSVGFAQTINAGLSGVSAGFTGLGKAITGALPKMGAWITSTWAAAAAHIAAYWPVYAIIAGVALLAAGVVLLIKNWGAVSTFFVNLWKTVTGAFSKAFDWIKNLLAGVSNKVLAVVAVFLPFIGIPALIIKNWDTIKAFFAGLWVQITTLATAAWNGIKTFFAGLWAGITAEFANAWNGILAFFGFVWDGITQTVAAVANWFSGVWTAVSSGFASAWLWVKDLFTSIWESIKGVVLGFVEWLSPVIDAIIAPFKAIGTVIGGIINTVGGWFGNTVELGKAELAKASENKTASAAATPVNDSQAVTTTTTAGPVATPVITPPAPVTTSAIAPPATGAAQPAGVAAPVTGGGSLLNEHLEAAGRKGFSASAVDTTAADAFMAAGTSAAPIDTADYERSAAYDFAEAVRPERTPSVQTPWPQPEAKPAKSEPRMIKIEHLELNIKDMADAFNFVKELELAVFEPVEVAV